MFDLLANVMSAPLLVPMDINIDPNTNGLSGINQLRTIVGAVTTIGLILSVLALIVWGFGANSSNPHHASRGKIGLIAVSAPTVEELHGAVAAIEQAAIQASCPTRLLVGQQAAAFTAGAAALLTGVEPKGRRTYSVAFSG